MKTIGISNFRKNLLFLLKEVQRGEAITILSRGKKVAMVVPLKKGAEDSKKSLLKLQKTVVMGDIVSPIGGKWQADK